MNPYLIERGKRRFSHADMMMMIKVVAYDDDDVAPLPQPNIGDKVLRNKLYSCSSCMTMD